MYFNNTFAITEARFGDEKIIKFGVVPVEALSVCGKRYFIYPLWVYKIPFTTEFQQELMGVAFPITKYLLTYNVNLF